jgi:outer membrane receptor protein involved in Fe transport
MRIIPFLLTIVLISVAMTGSAQTDSTARKSKDTATIDSLHLKSSNLKAVTVTARKPLIEQKADRLIVNVDAFISNTGTNILEALEKAPGVEVDKDGNISLKGKQSVLVLIDGRPAYVSGSDLAGLLKGMQTSQVDQIEIMTNPPAKYDAAGNAGIINIKTKKNKTKGFNGSVSAGVGQGVYFKNNESASLNYRSGKFNLFSNYSFSGNENFVEIPLTRWYRNEDKTVTTVFDQLVYLKGNNKSHNLKLGMDYSITNKTTLGLVLSGATSAYINHNTNTTYLEAPSLAVDSIIRSASDVKDKPKNGGINLNMRHQLDSAGQELTADLDYIHYDRTNDQYMINTTYQPNFIKKYDEQLLGSTPVVIDIYSAKVDYTYPLKNKSRFEMGAKSSYVQTQSKSRFYGLDAGEWVPDFGKTYTFDYREQINAAYVNLNKELSKKWTVQAGVRFENTHYKGRQYDNAQKGDSSFDRTYNNLFPTVYVSYTADKNNQFNVNFGRRIDRPGYQSLNPFLFFFDKYTYVAGNPYLQPQYSNNVELTHIYKGIITTTFNYSVTNNLMIDLYEQNGYVSIQRRSNFGRRQNAGVSVNAQITVAKWLTSLLTTNYNYVQFTGKLYGDAINPSASMLSASLNNQFTFKKGWSAELSGTYRSKGIDGQITKQPYGYASAGISKQVLKGKGTLKASMRDIFHTQKYTIDYTSQNTVVHYRNTFDTRVANITFTWRFGKPLKNTNSQRKKGGASDELNRVDG